MEDKPHKPHHASQSGAKADKKSKAKGKGKADHGKGYNEKVSKLRPSGSGLNNAYP